MREKTVDDTKKFTGKHALFLAVTFFGIIISVNIYLFTLAAKHWSGLVVSNSYVASQDFNKKQRIAKIQHELGWQDHFSYNSGQVTFSLKDIENKTIKASEVTVYFNRPAHNRHDHHILLTKKNDTIYQLNHKLSSGAWQVKLIAKVDGHNDWLQNYFLTIPTSQ